MAAQWETLRMAVEMGDFSLAASLLTKELGFESKVELLPLVRGLLASVVREVDWLEHGSDAPAEKPKTLVTRPTVAPKAAKRKGGFSARFASSGEGAEPPANEIVLFEEKEANEPPPDPTACALRRRRRTIAATLTDEAAIALQTLLMGEYKSEAFSAVATELDESWGSDVTFYQRLEAIDELCLRCVMRRVLPKFGFAGNAEGRDDMKAAVDAVAETNSLVKELQSQLPKCVFLFFANLIPGR